MGRQRRPTLVAEIGRLLAEYPEKDWRALVNRLREPAFMEDIASAIEDALVSQAKRSARKATTVRRQPHRSVIAKVAQDDKAKAEKLYALKSLLTDSENSLSLGDIRGFAVSLGMKDELANRRDQAINQIVRYLAAKTTDEIEAIVQAGPPAQRKRGQEFDRWVKLILGDDAPKE